MRVALHAGEVDYDEHGVTAASITLAFRLEADALKSASAGSPGVLALITSSWFYDEVVRHSAGSGPAHYRPVRVRVKETTTGWLSLPDHPYPERWDPPPAEPAVVPRRLPALAPHFVGREGEQARLTAARDPAAVVVLVVNGTAGVGKTAPAVQWAHQVAEHFPDGQLYVTMRGFEPTRDPVPPGEAVRGFLDAFEVPPARIHDREATALPAARIGPDRAERRPRSR